MPAPDPTPGRTRFVLLSQQTFAFAVVGGFVLMSMFMTLQGPAPSLPTGADPAVAPRQPAVTDERMARTDAEQMQRMGAVNIVADHAGLERVALEVAAEVNGKSPTAQRMLKFAFNLVDDGLIGQQVFAG